MQQCARTTSLRLFQEVWLPELGAFSALSSPTLAGSKVRKNNYRLQSLGGNPSSVTHELCGFRR